MKKADKSFFEYVLSRSNGPVTEWLKEIAEEYSKRLACPLCGDEGVDVIIIPKALIRCGACCTRSEISIDKIQLDDYNTVTFLHEETIKAILKAQESE